MTKISFRLKILTGFFLILIEVWSARHKLHPSRNCKNSTHSLFSVSRHTKCWERMPSKMPGSNNFLSFHSIIVKLSTKKELVIPYNPMFFVFEILAFFGGKMRSRIWRQILDLLIWLKDLFTRISKSKEVSNHVYPNKRYNVLNFELLLFLVKNGGNLNF